MGKALHYLVLDCETCGNDFTMKYTPEQRKTVNVVKSLIYDIGWTVVNRKGEALVKRSFLVNETFCVPAVFDTAYYADKRPQYLKMLRNGEIELKSWNDIIDLFLSDMADCDFFGAYNAAFDTRAMCYTDLYIRKLYSSDFYAWREKQEEICDRMVKGEKPPKQAEKDMDNFHFRDKVFPLFDIWRMSCEDLINTRSYKSLCLNKGMLSESGLYFKSSAETSYRYIKEKYDFSEAHMALDDALIEAEILVKILKKKAVTVGLSAFPFRELGTTIEYIQKERSKNRVKKNEVEVIQDVMKKKVESYGDVTHSFKKQLEKAIVLLEIIKDGI